MSSYYKKPHVRKRYREYGWHSNGVDPNFKWEDGEALYRSQNGVCGFCGDKLLGLDSRDTALDHDHITHKPRAWVHNGCNMVIGLIERRGIRGSHIEAYFNKF